MKNIHSGKIKGTNVIYPDKIRGIDTILEEGTSPKTESQDLLAVAKQICSVMILMDHPSSLIGTVGGLREMTVIGRVLKILMDRLGNHMVMAFNIAIFAKFDLDSPVYFNLFLNNNPLFFSS